MKIYIDLVLFLNFAFDFILLITTSILLKRNTKLIRIFLGSLIGSITIIILFIPFTTISLFIMKIILSILIIIITFGFKDIKYTLNNLFYFYITSIILGGFMYYLNIEFSYKNIGIVFYHKEIGTNYIFVLLISPIILFIYTKQMKKYKINNTLHHKVDLYINNEIINLNGLMDTGNTLLEPYNNKKIIIVYDKRLNELVNENNFFLVPIDSVNNHILLKCIKVDKVFIEGLGIRKDVVVGLSNERIKRNNINCILNYLLMEG